MEIKSYNDFVLDSFKSEVIDMHNPLCSNCNECCSLNTLITDNEYHILKNYFETKEGKVILNQSRNKVKRFLRKGTVYMMCPFTDDTTKRCRIYSIRPEICQKFRCDANSVKSVEILKQQILQQNNHKQLSVFFEDIFNEQFGLPSSLFR